MSKIKTKYELGNKIFYLDGRKVKTATITTIRINLSRDWLANIKEYKNKIYITYVLGNVEAELSEFKVFKSQKKLFKSFINSAEIKSVD